MDLASAKLIGAGLAAIGVGKDALERAEALSGAGVDVLVIDTAGPALTVEAEQGGLAGEIARCLAELVTLDTPTVSVLLGQGSGGPALAMVPADRVLRAADGERLRRPVDRGRHGRP